MSQESEVEVLPGARYSCANCGTRVTQAELQGLPSPRCSSCGFTVFAKSRADLVKQVKAV
ncbi:MAG: RNA polymerase Rbp10 [Thaumarchaeota archaeon]|nr:RNA polymerase Rbp10 [Nitrososphaerota archaeon]